MPLIPNVPLEGNAGTLILIGGGEFSFWETQEVDKYLLSRLRSKQVAFLPTASGSQEYAGHFGAYLKRLDPEVDVVNVPVYRPRDARRGKNAETIRSAGGVYIGGGVTNSLIETLHDSPVLEALREQLANGGVVAAIGAAASAFGSVTRDLRRVGQPLAGLGLVRGAVIETSYDPRTSAMLQRLMSVPEAMIGYGIPAKCGIAIGPSREGEILGDGSIAVVRRPS